MNFIKAFVKNTLYIIMFIILLIMGYCTVRVSMHSAEESGRQARERKEQAENNSDSLPVAEPAAMPAPMPAPEPAPMPDPTSNETLLKELVQDGDNFRLNSKDKIDVMTIFAVMLGRSIGCGHETDETSAKIGKWMDRHFLPGSNDQIIYMPIFMEGIAKHMKEQIAGESPDSCSAVKTFFESPVFLNTVQE